MLMVTSVSSDTRWMGEGECFGIVLHAQGVQTKTGWLQVWFLVYLIHRPINKAVVGSPSTGAYITFHYSTNNGLGKMVKGHVLCVFAVKAYKGSRGTAVLILNLCTGWRWVVNFTPLGENPGVHWRGDWVGPRVSLGSYREEKNTCPHWNLNPGPSSQ